MLSYEPSDNHYRSNMQAINFTAKTKELEFVQAPIPVVSKPNHVLIKVAYSGICGTDLHIIQIVEGHKPKKSCQELDFLHKIKLSINIKKLDFVKTLAVTLGEFPCNTNGPFTLGHEFSGTVVDIGSDVTIFKKGDRVAVDPNAGCNSCQFCHSGRPHFCRVGAVENTVGIYQNGGWADYAVVPMNQVHKLIENITLEQAALAEPISCVAHGWDIISPITIGTRILITGAGVIGNLWVCNLHLQGHKTVTVSEPNLARLKMLEKLNTGYELITPEQLKKNQELDPAYSFDLVIDCSGNAPAIEHAISLLERGGKMCIFGVSPPHAEIKIKPFDIYMKEMKIFGVLVNPFTFPKSLGLLEAMGDRYLNYENLGVKMFPLKEYIDAIESLKKGTIAKAIFQL